MSQSSEWQGPSVKEMIESRTLGQMIIKHQDGPTPIFDDNEMERLRSFVQDPNGTSALLREHEMQDKDSESPGTAASAKGSLAGYIAATYGTEKSALTEDDVVALKQWFNTRDE